MEQELSQHVYRDFADFLQQKLGIVLGDNRQYLVRSRLSPIARDNNYPDINALLKKVITMGDRELTEKCLELMTTNETFWFRDGYPFTLLLENVLPALHQTQRKLRIWSSACASGQEPFSIAISIKEFQEKHPGAFPSGVEVIATDFSAKMISHASAAVYDELAMGRGLSQHLKDKYFVRQDSKHMTVNNNVKSLVTFKRINLLDDYSSLGHFDVVFCRNVLIYFNGNEKANIMKKIAARLNQNGALFLGASESIAGVESLFKMQSIHKGLYYSKV